MADPKCWLLGVAAAGVLAMGSLRTHSTADDTPALRRLVASGSLPELRRPDFADCSSLVREFYESRNYAPAWTRDGKPTTQSVKIIQVIEAAALKGLDPADYDAGLWSDRIALLRNGGQALSDHDLARFDLALTVAISRYISDLRAGKANPGLLVSCLETEQQKRQIRLLLSSLVTSSEVNELLRTIEPPFPGYHRALVALRAYLAMAEEDDGQLLPAVDKPLVPGDRYAGTARLRRLLHRLGDLSADTDGPQTEPLYDGALVDAVKRFQRRHGLTPDGRIGKSTLSQLNTPLHRRVRQLQFTLERYRWVPHRFNRPPVVVNIPEFRLRGLNKSYQTEIEMKVVVGRAIRHQTPVFSGDMKYIVFWPYWNVPVSIQRAELVPKVRRDPSWLAKHGYEIVDRDGRTLAMGSVDATTLARISSGALRIRQRPGPGNALGLIKFVFPNSHNVYLHDTPATQLFSESRRDFSHGCIRVENAQMLASWILTQQPEWTPERVSMAIREKRTLQVNLDTPIPVLIVYATAIALDSGEIRFFPDIYGHDAALAKLLARKYSSPSDAKPDQTRLQR